MSGVVRAANHGKVGGIFVEGASLTGTTARQILLDLSGCGTWRIRCKFSVGGALSAAFVRPGQPLQNIAVGSIAVYAANNPGTVTVSDATETKMDITTLGEKHLVLTYTPTGTSVVTYVDLSCVPV